MGEPSARALPTEDGGPILPLPRHGRTVSTLGNRSKVYCLCGWRAEVEVDGWEESEKAAFVAYDQHLFAEAPTVCPACDGTKTGPNYGHVMNRAVGVATTSPCNRCGGTGER